MSKIIIGAVTGLFALATLWTLVEFPPINGAAFYSDAWVALGMADLATGFILMSVIIALVEGSAARAAPWIIAILLLGNFVSGVFLFVRFEKIASRLRDSSPEAR